MNEKLNPAKSESWEMFNRISPRYDFLNRLLSLGLDRVWRKQFTKLLPYRSNLKILDLATGTGDVLLTMVKENSLIQKAYGIDLAQKMLEIGRKKIEKQGLAEKIELHHADAQHIPFPENTFDVVTMAFGIRNMPSTPDVLKEIYRVLQSGGESLILEFSLPTNRFLRFLHLFYLRTIVPVIGGIFSGNREAYRYLNQTIEAYPYGKKFCQLLSQQGFIQIKAKLLTFGIATMYQAQKA